MTPLASFLLPFRDEAPTLAAAVRSLQAQTVPAWEAVLVDDGSRDDSGAIAEALARQDGRLRVLHLPGGAGLPHALNEGLARCRAPLVARMDADDLASPDRLALQLERLASEPQLGVVDGQVRFFRDEGEVPGGMRAYEAWINGVLTPDDFDRELLVESPVVHPAATFRTKLVQALGGYRAGDFPEDYDLWSRLHLAGHRLAKIPRVLVQMRDRASRLTRTHPSYSAAAFLRVRQRHLDATLRPEARVAVWGAARSGKPWLRWLNQRGNPVPFAIDIDPRRIGGARQGVPVLAPDQLARRRSDYDLLLVAVGARGAREEIRAQLRAIGLQEPAEVRCVC